MFLISSTLGQQTPSQRYQPVRKLSDQSAPPSVHLAPNQVQRITPKYRPVSEARSTGASYSFSDASQAPTSNQSHERLALDNPQTATIQQASYNQDEAEVPAILLGNMPTESTEPSSSTEFRPPAKSTENRLTPNDFAAGMSQLQSETPRIAPNEINRQQLDINAQMAEIRRRASEKKQAEPNAQNMNPSTGVDTQEGAFSGFEAPQQSATQIALDGTRADSAAPAQQSQADPAVQPEQRQVEPEATDNEMAQTQPAEKFSASQFIGGIASDGASQENQTKTPNQIANHPPQSNSNQIADPRVSKPGLDTNIRQVTSEPLTQDAAIQLAAPALEVKTYGPQTIGLNKPSTYKIVVKNNSNIQADQILVGVNLPQWVDIENVNLTTGRKEITDGTSQARLVWSIDKVAGNASQTITLTAVPRKAELFDVSVEWTLVPLVGRANVVVTEPKLEMTISGPPEVLYGETAIYHVTVRNPGTGAAENVIVMLPEALGGERATLGNIEPGKEKNFQVELLARTAGDLNLVATAAGDQEIKTSAERALVVRRANLDVSLEGPGLKYAGSGAQYKVILTNNGDATAKDIVTAIALPPGVKYLGGVESVKIIEGGLRWPVGNLESGQTRTYKINCQLDTSGDLQLEVGARGKGDLAASSACKTSVETVADLVLTVADPKGPLPTGEKVPYEIKVQNRGSKAAKGVNLVMQFSEGIEPLKANGQEYRIVPGQVLFNPITQIDPGKEMTFKITAEAFNSGTHIFRAQLTCEDSDSREIAEGTTRFFGEQIQRGATAATADASQTPKANSNDFGGDFQR